MKKWAYAIALLSAVTLSSCSQYDDTLLQNRVGTLEADVKNLKELCSQMNTNISAMQSIVNAIQNNDYVTGVAPVMKNGVEIGYTILFSKSNSITIYHGTDGRDGTDGKDGKDGRDGIDGTNGYTPVIGVQKDSDGVYYWTLDGKWLTDISGNKIKAVGKDGKDGKDGLNGGADGKDGENGADGKDGKDGVDGKDGITPKLKIEDDWWYISYDEGQSWTKLSKAKGEDGKDGQNGADGKDGKDGVDGKDGINGGDSFFKSVDTTNKDFIVFTLSDGSQLKLPTWYAFEALRTQCNQMNTNIEALQKIVSSLQNNDYITSCTPHMENGVQTGYVISFAKSPSIIVYNGKNGAPGKDGEPGKDGADGNDGVDGKDGYSPVVGVKKDTDNIYYWTLDGKWLTDADGKKVKAQGTDGKNGADGNDGLPGADGKDGNDGADGANGTNGKDGVTPQLKIEDGFWFVSTDGGQNWTKLGMATGANGKDGDSFFSSVSDSETKVTFVLKDGSSFEVPKESGLNIVFQNTEAIRFSLGSAYKIAYTLVGSDAQTSIEILCQDGLRATLEKTDETSGFVTVTTPYSIVERSTVIVLVSDGRGKTIMKALNFVYDGSSDGEKGTLIITTAKPLSIAAAGGIVEVPVQTNLSYRVQIDAAAQSWLTHKETVAVKSLRNECLKFEAAVNTGAQRRAFVSLVNLADESIAQTFCITQDADASALAETISFVDPAFEKIAVTLCDLDGDGKVSRAEALNLETLDITNKSITDLSGIEWFTNLRILNCSGNSSLNALDVSNNIALEELNCRNCKITNLDVSKNVALKILNCYGCNMKKLDVSNNPLLTSLSCGYNSITSLDLSHNPEITEFFCEGYSGTWSETSTDRIRVLNLKGCTKLRKLSCYYQLLASLNLSDCVSLTELNLSKNVLLGLDLSRNIKLSKLNCSYNRIPSLNLSHNASLTTCEISYNPLSTINVGGVLSLLEFKTGEWTYKESATLDIIATKLESASISSSQLTRINFSNNTTLKSVSLGVSSLSELDLSPLPNLRSIYISGGILQTLDLRNNRQLNSLSCSSGQLREVNLPNSESLTTASFSSCRQIPSIDFSVAPNLQKLDIVSCDAWNTLDLSNNLSLKSLVFNGSSYINPSLNNIDLGANPYIKDLRLNNIHGSCEIRGSRVEKLVIGNYITNKITNLNIKGLPSLTSLSVSACNMKTLDLSGNPHLKDLSLYETVETLDLTSNPELESITCASLNLKSINVTKCPLLKTMNCRNNFLETLDISGNPLLTTLNCSDMSTLKTLYLDKSQRIRYITYDRSTSYIPEQTVLEYK